MTTLTAAGNTSSAPASSRRWLIIAVTVGAVVGVIAALAISIATNSSSNPPLTNLQKAKLQAASSLIQTQRTASTFLSAKQACKKNVNCINNAANTALNAQGTISQSTNSDLVTGDNTASSALSYYLVQQEALQKDYLLIAGSVTYGAIQVAMPTLIAQLAATNNSGAELLRAL
jgi:hypothetical protein